DTIPCGSKTCDLDTGTCEKSVKPAGPSSKRLNFAIERSWDDAMSECEQGNTATGFDNKQAGVRFRSRIYSGCKCWCNLASELTIEELKGRGHGYLEKNGIMSALL
ncbi:LOW QUALITY PROTEIN: hypothetical protein MAR_032384, partial [Mya arenaria]